MTAEDDESTGLDPVGGGRARHTTHQRGRRRPKSPTNEMVKGLVDAFIRAGRPETALNEAARWGDASLVEEMLASGAEVNGRDENGFTAIMLAASGGHIDVVRVLIAAGADVNACDNVRGMPPLLWSLAGVHREEVYVRIASELLAAGANGSAKDGDGKTAADWARLRGSQELLQLLGA